MQQLSRSRTAVYLVFLVLVWGINWPLSKYALDFTPPILFAGLRATIGGLLLLFIAIPRYKRLNWSKAWPVYVISAILNIILYYGLQTIGLGYLPAGLFSALVFLQPVLLGVFSWLWLGEKMFALKWIGLILGFMGVFEISASGLAGHLSPVGIALAIGSALSWALGTLYVKKTSAQVDAVWNLTVQLIIGGIALLAAGSATEQWSAIDWQLTFILDLLFISVFVIALGWLVYFQLVNGGEVSKLGAYTFLIPLISIIISVIFLDEVVTWNLVAGMLLIVASIVLVNRKPARLNVKV